MQKKGYTPKRIRRSIKMDRVQASDFRAYDFIYACEQCSHFSAKDAQCTIGYPSHLHRREAQLKKYNLTGHMALCRFN